MIVTLDIKDESMTDNFLNFIKTLNYVDIKESENNNTLNSNKDNNKNKFSEFAGMWQNQDITIDSIRDEAWKQ